MPKLQVGWVIVLVLVVQLAPGRCASRRAPASNPPPDTPAIVGSASEAESILAARASLNQALQDRDVTTFARLWRADLRAIVGGNGGMTVGYDQNVELNPRMFSGSSFLSGERNPERIEVGASNGGHEQAAESGEWVWRISQNGTPPHLSGRYLIYWRKDGLTWKILQETYVTTACRPAPQCGVSAQP
ncbi:nuclear transport factor 2 family protein [Luteimonas vadosa]|uniref:DUF4440 domain-containing protein n=1 Tax=Luteimonas vadosa TaxID=1165507 RepID=A0ABP9E0Y9_9GAMM